MKEEKLPEFWMRGPVDEIPSLLQPVAHALLQARQEIREALTGFPDTLLWERPAGTASVGFHLLHIKGVLDRLFTYAKGEKLSPEQMKYLASEEKNDEAYTPATLLTLLDQQVNVSLEQLKRTDPKTLNEFRGVGRKQLPSTVLGLLFHSAEHTMRHTGQLLVTVRFLKHTI